MVYHNNWLLRYPHRYLVRTTQWSFHLILTIVFFLYDHHMYDHNNSNLAWNLFLYDHDNNIFFCTSWGSAYHVYIIIRRQGWFFTKLLTLITFETWTNEVLKFLLSKYRNKHSISTILLYVLYVTFKFEDKNMLHAQIHDYMTL